VHAIKNEYIYKVVQVSTVASVEIVTQKSFKLK